MASSIRSLVPVPGSSRTGGPSSDHSQSSSALPPKQSTEYDDDRVYVDVRTGEYITSDRRAFRTHGDTKSPSTDSKDTKVDSPSGVLIAGQLAKVPKQMGRYPPVLNTTPQLSHVFRFRANAGASNSIQTGFLFQACGCLATTTTSVQPIANSIKLNKIVLYLPGNMASADTAMVYWNYATSAGFIKEETKTSSLPDGITTEGQPLIFVPPPKSLMSSWLSTQLSSSNTACTIATPAGCIIDLHISYTIQQSQAGYSGVTVASATVGRMYYLPLDGVSANNLRPQGVVTTT